MLALETARPETPAPVPEASGMDALPISTLASPANERMVRAYLAALTGQPGAVDDLAQETFLRAIERIHLLPQYGEPARMLRGIARRVAQEHFRTRRRTRRYVDLTLELLAADDRAVARALERRETIEQLRAAVEELPIVSRRLLELRYHDSLRASDIGARLGLAPGAVRVTLLRIHQRLRRRLAPADPPKGATPAR